MHRYCQSTIFINNKFSRHYQTSPLQSYRLSIQQQIDDDEREDEGDDDDGDDDE